MHANVVLLTKCCAGHQSRGILGDVSAYAGCKRRAAETCGQAQAGKLQKTE